LQKKSRTAAWLDSQFFEYYLYLIVIICATYMYCEEMESQNLTFALKIGLHPTTLSHLSRMTSNFQEKVPIASTIEPPGGL
jgi:hypothetical protein